MNTRKPRPKTTGELVGVRIQPEMIGKLDDWRRGQEDLPGRPEAIRRLLEGALVAPSAAEVEGVAAALVRGDVEGATRAVGVKRGLKAKAPK